MLDFVHGNVWVPSKVASNGGLQFFLSFINDFSRNLGLYAKNKRSTISTIQEVEGFYGEADLQEAEASL